MNIDEYQKLSERTMNKKLRFEDTELHAICGIASEAGEVLALYQKMVQHMDGCVCMESLVEELGDLLWFVAELCTLYGIKMSEVCEKNIKKLYGRYPDGFDVERSINRDA